MTKERFHKIVQVLNKRQPDLTILMENVHKEHNLAAIARTCDAVGVQTIHAVTTLDQLKLTSDAASGSGKWVELKIHESTDIAFRHLKQSGFSVVAADNNGKGIDYRELDMTVPTAFVIGQELEGLSDKAVQEADNSVFIPMVGMVQSLNVSVATAILLYEAFRQRYDAGFYTGKKLDDDTYHNLLFEWCYPAMAEKYRKSGKSFPLLDDNGNIQHEQG